MPQTAFYQAIVTRYLSATDHKGSRVKAIADAGSVTLPWDHALNAERNMHAAAYALAMKFNWLEGRKLVGGSMPVSSGYTHCFVLVSK